MGQNTLVSQSENWKIGSSVGPVCMKSYEKHCFRNIVQMLLDFCFTMPVYQTIIFESLQKVYLQKLRKL